MCSSTGKSKELVEMNDRLGQAETDPDSTKHKAHLEQNASTL